MYHDIAMDESVRRLRRVASRVVFEGGMSHEGKTSWSLRTDPLPDWSTRYVAAMGSFLLPFTYLTFDLFSKVKQFKTISPTQH